jgi:nitrite reductase/ring-hydroxylating ferredoxin subunit
MAFTRLAGTGDVPPGSAKQFTVGNRKIALFNNNGLYYAIDDTCPHRGASLAEGEFLGDQVVCPWHAAYFDLATGTNLCPPARSPVASYKVEVVGDEVRIDLP